MLGTQIDGADPSNTMAGSTYGDRKVVKEGDVDEEKNKAVLMAAELRNTLMDLNAHSNNTTRRLDGTYYSVLEKVSILQSTITSLKELAAMARQLNEEFKAESEEVAGEFQTQLDSFDNFEEQQKKVAYLAGRVNQGRDKIKELGGRVELVRQRVTSWELAEQEWQENTRKRLRILWILMAIIIAALFAVMVFPKTHVPGVTTDGSLAAERLPEKILNETIHLKDLTVEMWNDLLQKNEPEEDQDEDSRLRIFDDL